MKFIVNFTAEYSILQDNYLVKIKPESGGLIFLKECREMLKDIKTEEIDSYFSGIYWRELQYILTEKQAIETNLFSNKSFIHVTIHGNKRFNKYFKRTIEILGTPESTKRLKFDYKLNTELLYQDWKDAGFPLIWKETKRETKK